jgi:hypothetical protein
MKSLSAFMLFLALAPLFTYCDKDDDADLYMQMREIAWNSLSLSDRSTVTVDWGKATVKETTFQDKEVYAVTFNTTYDALLGPIIVYIDKITLEVLGYGIRF